MFKTDNEDEERVSGGKQTLGLMAFIVLVVGAVTMIINFALGIANDKQITTWYQLVPVILQGIVGLLTYTVFTIVSVGFVKNKGKGVKICYWVSVVVAYAFVLIQSKSAENNRKQHKTVRKDGFFVEKLWFLTYSVRLLSSGATLSASFSETISSAFSSVSDGVSEDSVSAGAFSFFSPKFFFAANK